VAKSPKNKRGSIGQKKTERVARAAIPVAGRKKNGGAWIIHSETQLGMHFKKIAGGGPGKGKWGGTGERKGHNGGQVKDD